MNQVGAVQMSTAGSAQRLTTTDALSYLKNVKEIFQVKRDKYDDFLDVMKDFKTQRIDTSGVTLKVRELFKGYRNLILGCNMFLPKGFEIGLPPQDEPFLRKKLVDFAEAIRALFQNHADLFVEITHFLSDTSGAASVQYAQAGRNHIKHGDDRGSPMTIARPLHVEKRPAVLYAVCDHNISRPDLERGSHVEKTKGKKRRQTQKNVGA
ncbi:hypothetical protein OROMI_003825 [Orobanche minor]